MRKQLVRLYIFQFVLLLAYTSFVFMSLHGIHDVISMISYLICSCTFIFILLSLMPYSYKQYRRKYLAYYFRARSYIDNIVMIVDWTVFRRQRIRHRYQESVVGLVKQFNLEVNNRWSPLKWKHGLQLNLRWTFYVYAIILFILLLFICYEKYTAIPWRYHL